jgi:hypothetical protein
VQVQVEPEGRHPLIVPIVQIVLIVNCHYFSVFCGQEVEVVGLVRLIWYSVSHCLHSDHVCDGEQAVVVYVKVVSFRHQKCGNECYQNFSFVVVHVKVWRVPHPHPHPDCLHFFLSHE